MTGAQSQFAVAVTQVTGKQQQHGSRQGHQCCGMELALSIVLVFNNSLVSQKVVFSNRNSNCFAEREKNEKW